ncbi:hypothetical protein EZV62_008936 [Acer yangbiense]|uniref:Uncharacterized protein n=1 Tax=Acer yangbiense TaxID=1000413 RepID=A0A5C7IEW8_9ROSI|nr:hypothetical protein EZV62_008936 [Acer yangbiense]
MGWLMCCYQLLCLQLVLLHSLSSANLCSHDESSALLRFKQLFSFSNPSSSICSRLQPKMKYWKEDTDCCSWEGVTCDRGTSYVIGLDLSCSWLHGTIPSNSSLFLLSHLQKLNLAYNDFNLSRIPFDFARFPRLTHLNLTSSNFSGQVPLEISHLSKLFSLDLSSNDLTLETLVMKGLVQNMSHLQELFLGSVNMSTVALGTLTNINLPSLMFLSLTYCELQGSFPVCSLGLYHHLSMSEKPVEELVDEKGNKSPNPLYQVWITNDGLLTSWLLGTMKEVILSMVLEEVNIAYKFAQGLGNQYMDFRTAMLTKPPIPSFSQFVLSLQDHEQTLTSQREEEKTYIEHNQAFFSQRGRRGRNGRGAGGRVQLNSRGKGFTPAGRYNTQNGGQNSGQQNSNQPNNNLGHQQKQGTTQGQPQWRPNAPNNDGKIVCQICGKMNHFAIDCWYRFNYSYQSEEFPQDLATLTLHNDNDPSFYADSRATTHMTNDAGKLSSIQRYDGNDMIYVGDGNGSPISHIDDAHVTTHEGMFKLNDVLIVPELKKNLLFVGKFTSDNSCTFEFTSSDFVVKDRNQRIIARGHKKGQLYALDDIFHEALSAIRKGGSPHQSGINDLDILIQMAADSQKFVFSEFPSSDEWIGSKDSLNDAQPNDLNLLLQMIFSTSNLGDSNNDIPHSLAANISPSQTKNLATIDIPHSQTTNIPPSQIKNLETLDILYFQEENISPSHTENLATNDIPHSQAEDTSQSQIENVATSSATFPVTDTTSPPVENILSTTHNLREFPVRTRKPPSYLRDYATIATKAIDQ